MEPKAINGKGRVAQLFPPGYDLDRSNTHNPYPRFYGFFPVELIPSAIFTAAKDGATTKQIERHGRSRPSSSAAESCSTRLTANMEITNIVLCDGHIGATRQQHGNQAATTKDKLNPFATQSAEERSELFG